MSTTDGLPQSPPASAPSRSAAALLIAATLVVSWLGMMIVHESGHVFHAWICGSRVVKVVLHPLAISRTDVDPNRRPNFVAWGGPIWGCIVPLIVAVIARHLRVRAWPILTFFAGFCLIANGAYLGVGSWYAVGDALDLQQTGTPSWVLACFGLVTIPIGLKLWHGLGLHFGIGPNKLSVRWRTALGMTALAGAIIVLELIFSDRM